MRYFLTLSVTLSLAIFSGSLRAGVPDVFTIQGTLQDAGGIPISGSREYLVNFYDAETDGSILSQKTGTIPLSEAGRFTIPIEAFPASVLDTTEVWYQLSIDTGGNGVDGTDLFPGRVQIVSVPYALLAGDADTLGGQPASDFSSSDNVWRLDGNNASSVDFLGTTNNRELAFYANNKPVLRLIPKFRGPNVIAGHEENSADPGITDGGTISGGGFSGFPNRVVNDFSTVGGGRGNAAIGRSSAVAGGDQNEATGDESSIGGGFRNAATGDFSTVSGGGFNFAQGESSAIGGGVSNSASGEESFVGGGGGNQAIGENSAIGGGLQNEAANFAAVAGGARNEASGEESFIGGGGRNLALGIYNAIAGGRNNQATGSYSFVGGGLDNLAENVFSGVASGQLNRATGFAAFVGGGDSNDAGGVNSFVGGGLQNRALGFYDSVSGGESNVASGGSAHIGGGNDNVAEGGQSTIGGGNFNRTVGNNSAIGGGTSNRAEGSGTFIGGGFENRTGDTRATVGGGESNRAGGQWSTISGGFSNEATMTYGSVGGGNSNRALGVGATVAGGEGNVALGNLATIPGGNRNSATGEFSFAAGWAAQAEHDGAMVLSAGGGEDVFSTASHQFLVRAIGGVHLTVRSDGSGLRILSAGIAEDEPPNLIGGDDGNSVGAGVHGAVIAGGGGESGVAGKGQSAEPNQVLSIWGTIGGGSDNQIGSGAKGGLGGVYGTVAGGRRNQASGAYSTVPGGTRNTASGDYSLAAGQNAEAQGNGCFVWADSQVPTFSSTANDQFLIRAQGGVGIGRTTLTNAFEVEGDASKTVAGDWLANSDRRIKTDIDGIEDALGTINRLRPVKYRYTEAYKRDHPSIEDHDYYNYIAQEYAEVFPESVKEDAEGLLLMDGHNANIVAVKAIQELSEENRNLKNELDELRRVVQALTESLK